MKDKYQETFQTWDKLAELYEALFMELDLYEDTYIAFCQAVEDKEAAILEIGCGPGNITKRLLQHRPHFKMTVTDISPNMVKQAQKNNSTVQALELDARHLHQLSPSFEGIVAGFVLPYLSQEDVTKLVADSQRLLNDQGILYLSFVPGAYQDSGYITGRTGDRTYFYYHELAFLKNCLEQNNFRLLTLIEKAYPITKDKTEIHTILLTQKQMSLS